LERRVRSARSGESNISERRGKKASTSRAMLSAYEGKRMRVRKKKRIRQSYRRRRWRRMMRRRRSSGRRRRRRRGTRRRREWKEFFSTWWLSLPPPPPSLLPARNLFKILYTYKIVYERLKEQKRKGGAKQKRGSGRKRRRRNAEGAVREWLPIPSSL